MVHSWGFEPITSQSWVLCLNQQNMASCQPMPCHYHWTNLGEKFQIWMNDNQIFETILQITCIVSMANITNLHKYKKFLDVIIMKKLSDPKFRTFSKIPLFFKCLLKLLSIGFYLCNVVSECLLFIGKTFLGWPTFPVFIS